MRALKSKKARAVEQRADPSCKRWYICKGTLVYRRYGSVGRLRIIFTFVHMIDYIVAELQPAFDMFPSLSAFSTLGMPFPLAMKHYRKVLMSLLLNSFQWIDRLACRRLGVFQAHGYTNHTPGCRWKGQLRADQTIMKR